MPAAVKLLIGALAVILLGWAGAAARDRFTRKDVQHQARIDTLGAVVVVKDSIFAHDTITLHQQIRLADTLRRTLDITDTVRVRRVITQDSVAIAACVETVSSCTESIRARDALIAELRKPLAQRRFIWTAAALYDPLNRTALVRAGPELRLVADFSAIAEGAYDQAHGFAVRVGLKKTF